MPSDPYAGGRPDPYPGPAGGARPEPYPGHISGAIGGSLPGQAIRPAAGTSAERGGVTQPGGPEAPGGPGYRGAAERSGGYWHASGPLPQVPAVARQAAPADPYLRPSADPAPAGYGSQVAPPGEMDPGPPEISGPMPVTPWHDQPAISGPMPAVPAEPDPYPDPFPGQDADQGFPAATTPTRMTRATRTAGSLNPATTPAGRSSRWGRAAGRSRRGDGRPRRRGRRFSAPLIALLVLALFLSGGGIVGYHFLRQYVIPPDYSGSGYGSVVVQIKQNQTATDVATDAVRPRRRREHAGVRQGGGAEFASDRARAGLLPDAPAHESGARVRPAAQPRSPHPA